MHYCERCGSHLDGAYACPACGTAYSAPPTWQAPPPAAPSTGPHPLYQSLIPPMPQPAAYEVPDPPDEQPAEAAAESPAPPAPGPRRGAARSRRAARRRGGKTKLVLGVTGGLVLVGLAATVLPGELLPTGSSQADDAGKSSSSAMETPTATASSVPAAPQGSAPVKKPVPRRSSHSAQPSLSTGPGSTVHTAVPVSAPVAPARTRTSTPQPAPAQPTPSPRPQPTHTPTCFLLWCD